MCGLRDGVILLFLLVFALHDCRTRQISTAMLKVMTVLAIVFLLFEEHREWSMILFGLMIGIAFVLLSWFTREAVGYGDSWIILIFGICYGGKILFLILLYAFLLSGIFSLFGLSVLSWSRKKAIPFIPFLTVAYIGVVFL